jgi:hypothetical protein
VPGKVRLGKINIEPEVEKRMKSERMFLTFVQLSLGRYVRGDWGNVSPDTRAANDMALSHGGEISAVYRTTLKDGQREKVIISTDLSRSNTIISIPAKKNNNPEENEQEENK